MSQPVEVYPTPFPNPITQTPVVSSHHSTSNESFGTVFVVLAVIVVISAIACVLGRLCNKRNNRLKDKHNGATFRSKKEKEPKQNHNSQNGGDIEFGFDKRFSSAKVAANEDFRGGPKGAFQNGGVRGDNNDIEFGFDKRFPSGRGGGNEEFRGHKPIHNGKSKRELRFADDVEKHGP